MGQQDKPKLVHACSVLAWLALRAGSGSWGQPKGQKRAQRSWVIASQAAAGQQRPRVIVADPSRVRPYPLLPRSSTDLPCMGIVHASCSRDARLHATPPIRGSVRPRVSDPRAGRHRRAACVPRAPAGGGGVRSHDRQIRGPASPDIYISAPFIRVYRASFIPSSRDSRGEDIDRDMESSACCSISRETGNTVEMYRPYW